MTCLRPQTLRSQLVLLILGALLAAQAVSFWLFVGERGLAVRAALGLEAAGRAATARCASSCTRSGRGGRVPERMARMHRAMMGVPLASVEMRLSIALLDGGWLNVATRFHRPPLQWP